MSNQELGQESNRRACPNTGTVELLGVRIDALRLDEVLERIARTIAARQRAIVVYANVHALNLAYALPWFRAFLNHGDVVFCDGFGVKWGARLVGARIPERFTPPDWIERLAEIACRHDFSLYLVGARPGVAERVASQFRQRFPKLRVVGAYHGYFDKSPGSAENAAVIAAINAARPDVLIVGFGMPIQERWLQENWASIDARVALTAGAALDYLAGEVARAPHWMTDHGLEWLGRLIVEPRRLWRRYLIGNPIFLWRVLLQRWGLLRLR